MSIFEYDKEEEERKLRKAEYEAGKLDERLKIVQSLMEHGMSAAEIAGILKISEKDVLEMMKVK